MKIIFCNLPWWANGDDGKLRIGIRAGSRWPFTRHSIHAPDNFRFGAYLPVPFFLTSAAAWAQREIPGAAVEVRDSIARGESYAAFFQHLQHTQPDWLVVESATPCKEHDVRMIEAIKSLHPEIKIILVGTIVADCSFRLPECVDAACKGEYEKGVVSVIKDGKRGIVDFDLLTVAEMNAMPFPLYDPVCLTRYADGCPSGQQFPQLQVWTSRGCPFRCLSGDTPVNTVEGMIPIKELVGRESIGVFTYDPIERRAKVSTGMNIAKLGDGEKLVRVLFDDGSHIDCTPDHNFLAFKWGNQFTGEKEWRCEARNLVPGQHVRALNVIPSGAYLDGAWSRRGREKLHRMTAEWMIERRLIPGEQVHHKDRNKLNNTPENLEICASAKEHSAGHPEISQRMRDKNPTKNGMNESWRRKLSEAGRGKIRSAEQRERYRLAAILREAAKTPEQKELDLKRMVAGTMKARAWEHKTRGLDGRFEPTGLQNHRVVSVTELSGTHEVYCMEVPETGWFYANNVLVKNCSFCCWPAAMTGNDPDGTKPRRVRSHSPEWVEGMLRHFLALAGSAGTPFRSIYLDDDTFNLTQTHTVAISAVMDRIGLPWSAMCRADTVDRPTWQLMKDSGCFGVKIGFESGVQRVVDKIINKRLDIAKAAETARFLRSIGLTVHGTFTVGMPGETEAEQQQTIAFIRELHESGAIDTHQLSGTAVIEGTPLSTLLTTGADLPKYPGMHASPAYHRDTDGQAKIERISSPSLN